MFTVTTLGVEKDESAKHGGGIKANLFLMDEVYEK